MSRPANPELRSEILKAATEIIEGCGADCVTMREVAEKVGYSPTTLYLYFKDKGDVLKETVKDAFVDFADAMRAAEVGPTPIDKFRQRGRAYVVWGIMHPGLYQLMFQAPGDIKWTEEDLVQTSRGWMEGAKTVEDCVAAGQFRPVSDILQFGITVFAGLHGATSLAISRRLAPGALEMSPPQIVDLATGVADRLIEALIAEVRAA